MKCKTFLKNYGTAISIFLSVSLTIFGWYKTNQLNLERERTNYLLNVKNEYIANAFRDISFFSTLMNHNRLSKEDLIKLDRALKNIQLYGSKEEVKLARELIENLGKPGVQFDPLLNTIRDNLRLEFNLEKIEGNTYWFMDTTYFPRTKPID